MMNNEETTIFKKLYIDMIDGYLSENDKIDPDQHTNEFPFTGLNKSLLDQYLKNQDDNWKKVIYMMSKSLDYEDSSVPSRIGIRHGDFPVKMIYDEDTLESVVEFISKNIDIDKDIFSQVKDIPEWNESINYLADKYKEENRTFLNRTYLNGTVQGRALKKGDAAYNDRFEEESSAKKTLLVKPNLNINKQSYLQVRQQDLMKNPSIDLSQSTRTNFQHETQDDNNWNYLRLIMPNYLRRIEIEDLDRNFWVISQTLSGLCDLLFKNPILYKDTLAGILNELPQLWENIAYLWVQMAVLSQKEYNTEIQTIFLPIYNDQFESYVKFDNFELIDLDNISSLSVEELLSLSIENSKNLLAQYPNVNLFIVPEFRLKNLQHNHYCAALYPGAVFYNVNDSSWIKLGASQLELSFIDLTDQEDVIAKNLSGVKEENHTYSYIDNYTTPQVGILGYFYGLARTKLNLSIKLFQNGLNINNFSLEFYDVNRVENNLESLVGIINFETLSEIKEDKLNLNVAKTGFAISDSLPTIPIPINKGHYLGEILSGLPHFNLKGNLKVILFSQNQTDQNRQIQWTWDEYNSEEKQQDLQRRWNIVINNEKNELEKGEGRFLLRRVVCVNQDVRTQNVIEICDNFCFIFKQLNGEIVQQTYDIIADYSGAPAQKSWTEINNGIEYAIDKVIVSAVPNDVIGKHSTIYLGSMIDSVAVQNPENHIRGFIRYLNKNKTDTWESLTNKSQFYPLLEDSDYFWNWISNGTVQYPIEREDYYGGLIHDTNDSTALYVSNYEINQKYQEGQDVNWIENPPSSFSEQEEQVTRHSVDYAYPFSKVSTFTFSHGEVDTSQNQWNLKPFYIIVIDRAYSFSRNKQDKIAYYYKCELAEKENGEKYLKAIFKYFGEKINKFDKDVFDNYNTDYVEDIEFNIDSALVSDKIKRLMIKSEDIEEVLE